MSDDRSMPTVADPLQTVGVVDISDLDLESATYVSLDLLKRGIDVMDALGHPCDGYDVMLLPPKDDVGRDENALIFQNKDDSDTAVVVAPRKRDADQ